MYCKMQMFICLFLLLFLIHTGFGQLKQQICVFTVIPEIRLKECCSRFEAKEEKIAQTEVFWTFSKGKITVFTLIRMICKTKLKPVTD